MSILGEVLGWGRDWARGRAELRRARLDGQIKAVQTAAEKGADWEARAAQNAASSWLDEYWTAILTAPLLLAFLGAGDVVADGFASLETVPDWYRWAVGASVSFAFARKVIPDAAAWRRK